MSPNAQFGGGGQEVVAHLLPHRVRDECPRRRRALLALVVERAANQRGAQYIRPRRAVREHEVFAAGLAHQSRVALVVLDVGADLLPQSLEGRRRSGEVDAGQSRIGQRHIRYRVAVAGDHVDHTGRQPGRLQQLHGQVRRQRLRHRRLPHHGIAHQRRRGGQIRRDRGEVERRYRVDESVQRAVVGAVPFPPHARRLLRQNLAGEGDVEPPEIGQLAGRVDLGLIGGFGLPQHRRRRDLLPPRAGQQIGRAQEYRRALIERGCRPVCSGQRRGLHSRRRHRGVGRWSACPALPQCRCGCTTSIRSPSPIRWVPPMTCGRSIGCSASAVSAVCSRARSGEFGA